MYAKSILGKVLVLYVVNAWHNKYVMKDITDTVNYVCMTLTVATLPNGLQLRLHCPMWKVTVCTGHYYYIRALHVLYRSELIIT